MTYKQMGGGNSNASKKLYDAPELHVIEIENVEIICTSPFGEDGDGNMSGMGNREI